MLLRRLRDRRGQVTVFVAGASLGLVLVASLAVDGGRILAGRERAFDEAQEAARAGADALSASALRTGSPALVDPSAAVSAAQSYMHATGDTAQVSVAGDQVTVVVTAQVQTEILSLAGLNTVTVSGSATAEPERGTGP
jgi:hypothetical protein